MKAKTFAISCTIFFSLMFFCSTSFGATLFYAANDGGSPSTLWSIDTDTYAQFDFGTIDARINGLSSSGIPDVIYAADRAGTNRLLEINVSTNPPIVNDVGPFGEDIRGLAYDSTTGTLYGRDSDQVLYTINTATGAVNSPIGDMSDSVSMAAMSFDSSGTLYGMSDSGQDLLYTINTSTAVISLVNPGTPGPGLNQIAGIYIDPETDAMYGVRRNGDEAFYSISQTTATAAYLADLDDTNARALAAPPLPPAPPQAIPTMSEWGMIIMGLLVAGYAVQALREKKTVS